MAQRTAPKIQAPGALRVRTGKPAPEGQQLGPEGQAPKRPQLVPGGRHRRSAGLRLWDSRRGLTSPEPEIWWRGPTGEELESGRQRPANRDHGAWYRNKSCGHLLRNRGCSGGRSCYVGRGCSRGRGCGGSRLCSGGRGRGWKCGGRCHRESCGKFLLGGRRRGRGPAPNPKQREEEPRRDLPRTDRMSPSGQPEPMEAGQEPERGTAPISFITPFWIVLERRGLGLTFGWANILASRGGFWP